MKIKEVEELVGLDRGNIYYYEKEGLLNPKRNAENNYREYSEEDVEILRRIKLLRVLDISTTDIKRLNAGEASLKDVAKKQLEEFKVISQNIQHLQNVCKIIIDDNIDISELNEEILSKDKKLWTERLQEIAKKDIVAENIGKKELNRTICAMLAWGYFLNAVITYFFGDFLMKYHGSGLGSMEFKEGRHVGLEELPSRLWGGFNIEWWMIACIVISIGCWLVSHMTATVKGQVIIFHMNALILSPLIIGIVRMFEDMWVYVLDVTFITGFSGTQVSVFWMMIILYVLALYLISTKWEPLFSSMRYTFSLAVMFGLIYTSISYVLCGKWIVPAIFIFAMLILITFHWSAANMDTDRYNRYYAVLQSQRMMNLLVFALGRMRSYPM